MSAGEFFDLIRPVFLIVSALISTFVFASALRLGFRIISASIWALTTFFLPLVVFPLFILVRLTNVKSASGRKSQSATRFVSERFLLPFFYGLAIFVLIAIAQYREYNAIDAYLARAQQAKLRNNRSLSIREYRAALALEDNAHTHKLLAQELSDNGNLQGALAEFRLAEQGGEEDETLPFTIAKLLDSLNQPNQAIVEYKRFLYGGGCQKLPLDSRCKVAADKVNQNEVSNRQ
jgi:hypothetical protein